jgi:hypothetical protein
VREVGMNGHRVVGHGIRIVPINRLTGDVIRLQLLSGIEIEDLKFEMRNWCVSGGNSQYVISQSCSARYCWAEADNAESD